MINADFVKMTDLNDKLKNINEKVTENKARHLEDGKNLNIYQEKLDYY